MTETAFVESCQRAVVREAEVAASGARTRPRAAALLRLLAEKKNILVTAHAHPDPDALAACLGLRTLLQQKLPDASVRVSFKGRVGGGLNNAFVDVAPNFNPLPWDDAAVQSGKFDAIILLDCQPSFAFNPLPAGVEPTAVIDHHRSRPGKRPTCGFCDVRRDVGATSSIVFSYFMELQVPFSPTLAAMLLYAIESDLAGTAGTPGHLDNVALSSLTLLADTRKLYTMRYVDMPISYYAAYHLGLRNATVHDAAIASHIGPIDTIEKPAVLADFLLRAAGIQWVMVSAIYEDRLGASIRCRDPKLPASDAARRIFAGLGEGGGHRTKAGGFVQLTDTSEPTVERMRAKIRQRFLQVVGAKDKKGQKLVPSEAC